MTASDWKSLNLDGFDLPVSSETITSLVDSIDRGQKGSNQAEHASRQLQIVLMAAEIDSRRRSSFELAQNSTVMTRLTWAIGAMTFVMLLISLLQTLLITG